MEEQLMKNYGYGQVPLPPSSPHINLNGHASIFDQVGGATFAETLASTINKANTIMSVPEELTIQAVTTGNVDIHEVMIALGKSEVAFKLITAVTQKAVGGFDKLTSMQI